MLNLESLQRHAEQLSNSPLLHYVPSSPGLYAGTILLTIVVGPAIVLLAIVLLRWSENLKQRLQIVPIFAIGSCLLFYGHFIFSPVSLTPEEIASFNQLRLDSGEEQIAQIDYVSRAALSDQVIFSYQKIDDLLLLRERLAAIGVHPDENQLIAIASLERK